MRIYRYRVKRLARPLQEGPETKLSERVKRFARLLLLNRFYAVKGGNGVRNRITEFKFIRAIHGYVLLTRRQSFVFSKKKKIK